MRLRELMRKDKLDGLVLTGDDPNFFYVLRREGQGEILFIPKRGKAVLVTSALEDVSPGVCVVRSRDKKKALSRLTKGAKKVGINERVLSVGLAKLVHGRKVPMAKSLAELRSIKTGQEIDLIRASCRIAGDILNAMVRRLPSFKSEGEIKRFLKVETAKRDCALAYEPIVASGRGAGIPHYRRERPLSKGFLIVDFGVKYKGYCSDITRTFFKGAPSSVDKARYELVRSCQEQAIGRIRAYQTRPVEGHQVYALAKKALGKHKVLFTHGLGHGFGIEIHEYPSLSKAKGHVLKEGMVVTVEPGIYAKYGIRIEDDLYLGKNVEIMTSHVPKKLVCF